MSQQIVLITRPTHQAKALVDLLQQQGHRCVLFPTIKIQSRVTDKNLVRAVLKIQRSDCMIFLSVNAVQCAQWLLDECTFSQSPTIIAIGDATAAALQQRGLAVIAVTDTANSENLLQQPQLQSIAGQHISIFCGTRGNKLVAQICRERGAVVQEFEVYERQLPEVLKLPDDLLDVSVVVCTSNEILMNLISLLTRFKVESLWSKPLIVISKRMYEYAKNSAFTGTIKVADGASNVAILRAIETL